jgi:tRNA pseudouridine38-40 synthase
MSIQFLPTMPTQRYKLTIAYRGTNYHGWQTQSLTPNYKKPIPPQGQGIPTIQETLSRAIRGVVNHPVTLSGSSRTDAGVHAKGQIAAFDTDQLQIPIEGMRRAINAAIPEDILVRTIEPAPPDFNPITWTTSKRYQYVIWNQPNRAPFFPDLAWHRWQELDHAAMKDAASRFVGEHDFASFSRPGHGRESTVRTMLSCKVSFRAPRLIVSVEGTGFLWNMVRIMVGTLVEVGLRRFTPDDMDRMLAAKDRTVGGQTAPPQGLYLQWIKTGDGPRDS